MNEPPRKSPRLQLALIAGVFFGPLLIAAWLYYSGYFADPDGHLWEVAHNPFSWIGPPETGES